jgi:hypothetical protein
MWDACEKDSYYEEGIINAMFYYSLAISTNISSKDELDTIWYYCE